MAKPLESRRARGSLAVLRQTQQQLADNGLRVAFWALPWADHGQMFEVSLRSALLHLSGRQRLRISDDLAPTSGRRAIQR
ncbi:esterase_lipase family protein IroE [Klebsiella quasipneumoniae]|nr:esterase_lipase family protein IroE [Klebsiella quasipneumoniae]